MANLDWEESIFPDTPDSDSIDLDRLVSGTIDLPLHVLDDNTDSNNNNDNANGPANNCGTNILSGGVLRLRQGTEVTAGSIYVRGAATGNGGRLELDGAALNVCRLPMEGQNGGGGTLIIQSNETDTDRYPSLRMYNGSILTMLGSAGHNYRAFLGNWSKGRIVCYDSTIQFLASTNYSGFAASGNGRSNAYLGFRSRFRNSVLTGFNKIELLGAIDEFDNVTLEYTTNGDLTGNSGALYLAGAPNIVGALGAHTLIVPSNLDMYSGNAFFKYASTREAACELSLNGRTRIERGTDSFSPRLYDFYFEGANGSTRDLSRRYRFNTDITASVGLIDSSGAPLTGVGDSEARYAIMDNRDFLAVSLDSEGITNGSTGARQVPYYNLPHHAIAANRADSRVTYGWPTGKAAAFPGAVDGSSRVYTQDDAGTIRGNGEAFDGTNAAATLTLDLNTDVTGHLRQDLRRFFPMRAGYHQWGFYPEFVNSGLGTQAFLGITGNGVDGTTLNVGNGRVAEAAAADLRDGVSLSITASQDPIMSGVTQTVAADRSAAITAPTSATGVLTVAIDSENVSLDHVYQRVQKWTYDNITNSTATWTPTALSGSTQDGTATSQTGATSVGASDVLFYSTAAPAAAASSVASNAAWNTIQSCRIGGTAGRPFVFTTGTNGNQNHQWLNGYVYFHTNNTQWALFSFTRDYSGQANNDDGYADATQFLRLTHVASQGTVGSDNTSYNFQRAELQDSLALTETYPARSWLWQPDVGCRPMESASNVVNIRDVRLENRSGADGVIVAGTLDTVNLNDNSTFDANGQTTALNFTGSGTITGLLTGSSINAFSGSIGSGVTVEFAGGNTYNVNGDASAATFSRTGSGIVTLILGPNGVIPTGLNATQFQTVTQLTLTGFADSEHVDVYDFRTGSDSDITVSNLTTKRLNTNSITSASNFGSATGFSSGGGAVVSGLGGTIDRVMVVTSAAERIANVQIINITAGGANPVTISSSADTGYNTGASIAGTRTPSVLTSGTHSGKLQIAVSGTGLGNAPSNRAVLDVRDTQAYRDVMAIHELTGDYLASEGVNGWSIDVRYAIMQTAQLTQYFTGGTVLNGGGTNIFSISTADTLSGGGSVTLVVDNRSSPTGISSDAFSAGTTRLETNLSNLINDQTTTLNTNATTQHNNLRDSMVAEFEANQD